MKSLKILVAAFSIVLAAAAISAAAAVEGGAPAPAFSVKDINGKTQTLSDYRGKIVVLEWLNYDCPFIRKHYDLGNMQSLQKKYTDKGVVWISVCSSAPGNQGYYSPEELAARIKTEGAHPSALIRDETGELGRLYGAKTTPHMFVINKDGIMAYHGAIDDRPSFRAEDVKGAHNYVAKAIESVMQGKAPPVDETPSYGCSVKY